jgi:hypothetical protein
MVRGSLGIVETAVVGRSWPAPGDTTSAGALSSERGPRGSIVWGKLALRPERSRCPYLARTRRGGLATAFFSAGPALMFPAQSAAL